MSAHATFYVALGALAALLLTFHVLYSLELLSLKH